MEIGVDRDLLDVSVIVLKYGELRAFSTTKFRSSDRIYPRIVDEKNAPSHQGLTQTVRLCEIFSGRDRELAVQKSHLRQRRSKPSGDEHQTDGFFTRSVDLDSSFQRIEVMSKSRYCEICKQPIEQDRAENDAKTRLCRVHAIEIEKYGGEFKMTASQERTSKEGSLKINYGAVATNATRNQEAIDRLREDYLDRQND
jgi:hypothetical protein